VFAMGLVYGAGKGVYDNGTYKNKTAFLTFTTGGPEIAYSDAGKNGNLDTILYPIQHGMLYFAGMTVMPPFVCFSPARITDEERKQQLILYRYYLENIKSSEPIYKAP
jgi:NAD(P)H dehydrogenase (quinone)